MKWVRKEDTVQGSQEKYVIYQTEDKRYSIVMLETEKSLHVTGKFFAQEKFRDEFCKKFPNSTPLKHERDNSVEIILPASDSDAIKSAILMLNKEYALPWLAAKEFLDIHKAPAPSPPPQLKH